ncbi:MAG: class I SAM-dependent methyltransferase [Pseudomonadota bacterium]
MIEPLYDELSELWLTLSPPEQYAEAGELYAAALAQAAGGHIGSLLELGAGAGHLAASLPGGWRLTLVDRAPRMLALCAGIVPRAERILGDMRSLRLGRTFDAVLLQDAVMYLRSEQELREAFATAAAHLRPGGALLVVPDTVAEDFEEHCVMGGRSEGTRAAQLMEWHWDPDPSDTTYQVDFAALIRDSGGLVRCAHDRHTLGLFPASTFARLLQAAGFELLEPEAAIWTETGVPFLARRS